MWPLAWQFQSGGCADGSATFYVGGRGGAYPNAFTAAPAVTGRVDTQNGEHFAEGPLTPNNTALFWLSAAGAAGQARNPATEYGIWAIKFDVSTTGCTGSVGNSEASVCLGPHEKQPSTGPDHLATLIIVDENAVKDYAAFDAGFDYLTWFHTTELAALCPAIVPVHSTTWGQLKRVFH